MAPTKTVVLNVSGTKFEVARQTIEMFPEAYLARLLTNTEAMNGEPLFVDRDASLFPIVLNYYRNGEVDVPPNVSLSAIQREMDFFCLDVDQTNVHVQNVGERWHERMRPFRARITQFFATLFETEWFGTEMERNLEITIVMGPGPMSGEEIGPSTLFATKTARVLATKILSSRFNLASRWEVCDCSKPPIQLTYPRSYEYYPPSNTKVYQLVLFCNIGDEVSPSKRARR